MVPDLPAGPEQIVLKLVQSGAQPGTRQPVQIRITLTKFPKHLMGRRACLTVDWLDDARDGAFASPISP